MRSACVKTEQNKVLSGTVLEKPTRAGESPVREKDPTSVAYF